MTFIGEKTDKVISETAALAQSAIGRAMTRTGGILCTDVSGKAMLYFVPLFLAPFADKLGTALLAGTYPSCPQIIYCAIVGTIAACIGLRAYYDGSYQRRQDEVKSDTPENKTP